MNNTANGNRSIGFLALMILGVVFGVGIVFTALVLPSVVYAVWLIIACMFVIFGR